MQGEKKHLPDYCTTQKTMDIHTSLQFFKSTSTFESCADLQCLHRSRLITLEKNLYIQQLNTLESFRNMKHDFNDFGHTDSLR